MKKMKKPDYAEDIEIIKYMLKKDHGLSETQAKVALRVAHIEQFFRRDPDMAAHDSPWQWADFAYGCWKNRRRTKAWHMPHAMRGKDRFVPRSFVPRKRKDC